MVLMKYYRYRGPENQEELNNLIWHTENGIKYHYYRLQYHAFQD